MEVLREDLTQREQEAQRRAELGELEPAVAEDVEDDVLDDGVPAITVVESEVHDVISEMLSPHEGHVRAIPVPVKVEAFVEFNGNRIFKST